MGARLNKPANLLNAKNDNVLTVAELEAMFALPARVPAHEAELALV